MHPALSTVPPTWLGCVLRGAYRGARFGAWVAAFEILVDSLGDWFAKGSDHYPTTTASFALVSIGAFLAIGGAWGLVVGALDRASRAWVHPTDADLRVDALLALLVPVAATWHASKLVASGEIESEITRVLAIALGAACVLSALSERARALFTWLTNPVAIASALVIVPWAVAELWTGMHVALRVLLACCVALAPFALARVAGRALGERRSSRIPGVIAVLLASALAVGVAGTLERPARQVALEQPLQRAGVGQPNVLLITLDCARADHFGDWGYSRDTTPNLKEFSARATRFADAIAPSDQTLASHASLFTGLYPRAHGASPTADGGAPHPLAPEFATWAELFAEHGIRTVARVANFAFLSREFGLDQGFEVYDDRPPVPAFPSPPPFALRAALVPWLRSHFARARFDAGFRRAGEMLDATFATFESAHASGERVFAFTNLVDAHAPFDVLPPWDAKFPGRLKDLAPNFYANLVDDVNAKRRPLGPKSQTHLISQYDGALAYVDAELGRFFARLRELGEWEHTLIVIAGDHGEAFGERSLVGHGVSVYQDQVHVPLWIKYPEQGSGATVNERVSLVDVLPTVLDALSLEIPPRMHGRSLTKQSTLARRAVFAENVPMPRQAALHARFRGPERAVFLGPWKLVQRFDGSQELYDLGHDPDELAPSADLASPAAVPMIDALDRYLKWVRPGRASEVEALERQVFHADVSDH